MLMKNYSDKEELEFVESLFDDADEQLKEVYKEEKKNKDDLLQSIGSILLTYTIINDVMAMNKGERDKEYVRLSKTITTFSKSQAKLTEDVITNILTNTVNNTYDFYSYNAKLKDVKDIIDANYKGKHFSKRVWDNQQAVAKHLHLQTQEFLKGNVSVNQIKNDLEQTFNTSAYNAKRLAETEVNRCEDQAFRRFCKETGVKTVKRNEINDAKECDQCAELNGKIFDLDKAPGVVHPCCRGFNTIVE